LKAIIFDLDGTLVNTLADLTDSMNHALSGLGQPTHDSSVIRNFIGDGVFTFASRALPPDARHLADEVVRRMREHYKANCLSKTAAYPGMVDVVAQLKRRGMALAVLTNKDQNVARSIVEHCFGKGVFDRVVGVVDKTPVKPGREAVTKLMTEMGLTKDDCLFVGDSGIDIDTAKAAGIRSVGVTWGFRDRPELVEHGAAAVIDSAAELLRLI
jgi:phosphoglycolate phosphatase